MAKVITLSRTFPAYHPQAGHPTYFVEKVLNSLLMALMPIYQPGTPVEFISSLSSEIFNPKHHTIRAGKRWKDGDMASLRVWSGKPYNSPQIAIAPDVKLTVKDVEIGEETDTYIDGKYIGYYYAGSIPQNDIMLSIAKNDGLHYQEMIDWFSRSLPFSGQMLIWNNNSLPY